MHGYVEMMERLAYFMPEGRDPTDDEILAAMREERAAKIDAARDRAKEFRDMNARMTQHKINEQLTELEILALMADEVEAAQEYERDFDPPEDDELPEVV